MGTKARPPIVLKIRPQDVIGELRENRRLLLAGLALLTYRMDRSALEKLQEEKAEPTRAPKLPGTAEAAARGRAVREATAAHFCGIVERALEAMTPAGRVIAQRVYVAMSATLEEVAADLGLTVDRARRDRDMALETVAGEQEAAPPWYMYGIEAERPLPDMWLLSDIEARSDAVAESIRRLRETGAERRRPLPASERSAQMQASGWVKPAVDSPPRRGSVLSAGPKARRKAPTRRAGRTAEVIRAPMELAAD